MGDSALAPKIFFREPAFFPQLEFFFGLINSDIWFVIDHTIFTPRSEQNHCRLRSQTGIQLLSVPTQRPCVNPINKTVINSYLPWKRHFLRQIRLTYAKAPYFKEYFNEISYLIEKPCFLIHTLNMDTTLWIAGLLHKTPEVVYSSTYYQKWNKEKVAQLFAEKSGGTTFSEPFECPRYKQIDEPFIPNLSIVDALFSVGAKEVEQMLKKKSF